MENKNKRLKEVELYKANRASRALVILSSIAVVGSLGISFFVYAFSQQKVRDLQSKVIVLDQSGNMMEGEVVELNQFEQDKIKAENVLRTGIEYMFSFSSINYEDRIKNARAFFGKAGDEILQGYLNDRVKEKVKQNNLRVDVVIKSLSIDAEKNNIVGNVVYEQSFINGNAVTKRTVSAKCTFKKVDISSKNGYGLVIEDWIVIKEAR